MASAKAVAGIIVVALITACSSNGAETGPPLESAQISDEQVNEPDECGRVEAAARSSTVIFTEMEELPEACARGESVMFTCNPAAYAALAFIGVVVAPVSFVVGLFSEDVERYRCREARKENSYDGQGED